MVEVPIEYEPTFVCMVKLFILRFLTSLGPMVLGYCELSNMASSLSSRSIISPQHHLVQTVPSTSKCGSLYLLLWILLYLA